MLVLDRNNYHTFFPLLYQVAAAEIEPEDIVYPVRSILRRHKNIRFLMNEVTGIDLAAKQVKTTDAVFPYDFLVLAIGSNSHFFGVKGAAEHAFPLKTLGQAIAVRNQILLRFERALYVSDPVRRKQMLTFAIVGGGPTGVEFSGALSELIRGPAGERLPGPGSGRNAGHAVRSSRPPAGCLPGESWTVCIQTAAEDGCGNPSAGAGQPGYA